MNEIKKNDSKKPRKEVRKMTKRMENKLVNNKRMKKKTKYILTNWNHLQERLEVILLVRILLIFHHTSTVPIKSYRRVKNYFLKSAYSSRQRPITQSNGRCRCLSGRKE